MPDDYITRADAYRLSMTVFLATFGLMLGLFYFSFQVVSARLQYVEDTMKDLVISDRVHIVPKADEPGEC